jgi:Dos2-interacting transcription regulator of RNA-Pol-II
MQHDGSIRYARLRSRSREQQRCCLGNRQRHSTESELPPCPRVPQTDSNAELESRQVTLIEVVQSLGEYINDEDDKIRARAVSYLTAIISALHPAFLTRQQMLVLSDFLGARIEDGGAIEGLSKLQASSRFTKEMAQSLVKA